MKPTALSLAIAAVAFGASTIWLSMQLHDEQVQSDRLATEVRALNARIAELRKARTEQQFANGNPFAPVMVPPGAPSGRRVYAGEMPRPDGDFSDSVVINSAPHNDEAFRKMMRTQVRAHHKQLYTDIGARLGLNKDEARQLIDLLTEQQINGVLSFESMGVEDTLRQMEQKGRQDQAKIAELIGADKAESLAEYQQSLPARQELDMLARQLDGADAPLDDEQRKRLLAVLVDERKRIPAPTMNGSTSAEDYSRAFVAWQEGYEERVAAQTRTILKAEQLTTYDEYQDWQKRTGSQMGVVHPALLHRIPGGAAVMFTTTTAAPALGADVAIAAPDPAEDPRP
jgi:hypothetical protein